ncbi:ECA polysaccharide chain length modulation protein [compost metagenome]
MTEYISTMQGNNREINLLDLIQGLWVQRRVILLLFLLGVLCSSIYVIFSERIYEASVSVMPPTLSAVEGFNLGRDAGSGLKQITSADAYAVFKKNIFSDETKRRFFRDVYMVDSGKGTASESSEKYYKEFLDGLKIKMPEKAQPDRYTLSIQHQDPELATRWLDQYIGMASKVSIDEMLKNSRSQVAMKSEGVRRRLSTMREIAKVRREDRIAVLKEALTVAEAVGLENPPVITNQLVKQLSAEMEGDLMYMRGAKALRAEIKSLEARKSDDPFIKSLRSLEEKQALYNNIEINPEAVQVFSMDGVVETPETPVKPKKSLVMLVGVVAGLALGILVAIGRLIVERRLIVA